MSPVNVPMLKVLRVYRQFLRGARAYSYRTRCAYLDLKTKCSGSIFPLKISPSYVSIILTSQRSRVNIKGRGMICLQCLFYAPQKRSYRDGGAPNLTMKLPNLRQLVCRHSDAPFLWPIEASLLEDLALHVSGTYCIDHTLPS